MIYILTVLLAVALVYIMRFASERKNLKQKTAALEIELAELKSDKPNKIPYSIPDFSLAIMSPSGLLNPAMHDKNRKPPQPSSNSRELG